MELLAPAGSFETALAAFEYGADAVYLGLADFSARADAVNFTVPQLRDLIAYAHSLSPRRKVYVTFNTLVNDVELPAAVERLAVMAEIVPDGVIVQDLGIARLIRRHFQSLALHASTQLVAHNLEGVLALKELGFTRVVLSRELSIDDIRSICRRSGVEIETFVHGALCYSVSGLCLFSAMEKARSGNRGRCAYCCRLAYDDAAGKHSLPFSMRDLRLDDSLEALTEAGVASLKIEGRMKSALYVSTVTRRYRELLDGKVPSVSRGDLESVFSRRTTSLYAHGYDQKPEDIIDPSSLGHLGTAIGTVKRVTRDREGRFWLRFHTSRAIEKHDGLQFSSAQGGKPDGFGVGEMRLAISRRNVFEARAGADVEILLPPGISPSPGQTVYCSASNELKRRFPVPSFRTGQVQSGSDVDVVVTLSPGLFAAECSAYGVKAEVPVNVSAAKNPSATRDVVERAFSRLGETQWNLGALQLVDPDGLFAPASALNALRRALVERLDERRGSLREEVIENALSMPSLPIPEMPMRSLRLRIGQTPPEDGFNEYVYVIGRHGGETVEAALESVVGGNVRLALPVFTLEKDFNVMRGTVKHLLRCGFVKWEASDLATLRMLRQLGVGDITADWPLYAFNRSAVLQLAELGITRFVCSPESSGNDAPGAAFLDRQSTPLFISMTRPMAEDPSLLVGVKGDRYRCFQLDGLWITVNENPRCFSVPQSRPIRTDISWDCPIS